MTLLTDAPALAPGVAAGLAPGLALVPAPAAPPSTGAAPAADRGGAPSSVRVAITGALDLATLPRVRVELEQAVARRPARLVVDLSGCTFLDASALAVLLDVHRHLSRAGGVLTLSGCCPRVLRLLSLTGLRRVFDLA